MTLDQFRHDRFPFGKPPFGIALFALERTRDGSETRMPFTLEIAEEPLRGFATRNAKARDLIAFLWVVIAESVTEIAFAHECGSVDVIANRAKLVVAPIVKQTTSRI